MRIICRSSPSPFWERNCVLSNLLTRKKFSRNLINLVHLNKSEHFWPWLKYIGKCFEFYHFRKGNLIQAVTSTIKKNWFQAGDTGLPALRLVVRAFGNESGSATVLELATAVSTSESTATRDNVSEKQTTFSFDFSYPLLIQNFVEIERYSKLQRSGERYSIAMNQSSVASGSRTLIWLCKGLFDIMWLLRIAHYNWKLRMGRRKFLYGKPKHSS